MYILPPSFYPKTQKHVYKHQKKKLGQRSFQTKPNKLNLITPLPNSQVYSNYHSVKYNRDQSCADKSSSGSNHDSKHKYHSSYYQNLSEDIRRYTDKRKKIPKVTLKVVTPTIDSFPVNNVTEDNIDPCFDPVPASDGATTLDPLPRPVPIRKGRKLKQIHRL